MKKIYYRGKDITGLIAVPIVIAVIIIGANLVRGYLNSKEQIRTTGKFVKIAHIPRRGEYAVFKYSINNNEYKISIYYEDIKSKLDTGKYYLVLVPKGYEPGGRLFIDSVYNEPIKIESY